LDEGSLLTDIS